MVGPPGGSLGSWPCGAGSSHEASEDGVLTALMQWLGVTPLRERGRLPQRPEADAPRRNGGA